jgi:hypothetical protein
MESKQPEICDYGITLHWSEDDRIAIIATEGDMSREAVDTWARLAIKTIQSYKPGEIGYILFNMTGPGQRFTTYGAQRTLDVYRAIPPHLQGYAAVLLADTTITRMMTALLKRELHLLRGGVVQKFFQSYENAEAWLRECMAAQDAKARTEG